MNNFLRPFLREWFPGIVIGGFYLYLQKNPDLWGWNLLFSIIIVFGISYIITLTSNFLSTKNTVRKELNEWKRRIKHENIVNNYVILLIGLRDFLLKNDLLKNKYNDAFFTKWFKSDLTIVGVIAIYSAHPSPFPPDIFPVDTKQKITELKSDVEKLSI
jgi:MFS family permease